MKTTAAALLALLLPCVASAQQPTARDFARWSEVNEVALSPDGKFIAMAVPADNNRETQLQIVPLDGVGKVQTLRFGKMEHVSNIIWTADNTVTVARATNLPLEPRPYSRGQLFSTDTTGKKQQTLFGYFADHDVQTGRRKDDGFADLIRVLDDEPGKVLIDFQCWDCGEKPDSVLYKVDTRTGDRQQLEHIHDASGLWVDTHGRARIFMRKDDNDEPHLFYRPTPASEWTPVPVALAGYTFGTVAFDADDNTAYAEISDQGEASSFYKLDLKAGTRTKLPSKAGTDIDSILRAGRNGPPFALVSNLAKPSVQYFDPQSEYAQLHAGLMKAFPGHLIYFSGFTRDNGKLLFYAISDHDPGAWYLLDRKDNSMQRVAESYSWLKPEQMATVIPIEYKARDGETINGFLTTNHNGPGPMVVLPHGGPHGVNDTWGFDPEAQFLASRGYAVLQVNYRGSGGRGHDFVALGYREWGGKMQDDIADGVKWVIDHKGADPNRICTFGASYGGYAALMQVIRYPELYKCAIGYAGVYDLALMRKVGDIQESKSGMRYLDRVLGKDQAVLAANSPARNVDKIKVPVFLAHGSIDQRVPMDQFNTLKHALEGNGAKVETMVADGEGHGFYGVDNVTQLYERMDAFLKKYIGEGAPKASN
ncbi:alpha/beta hydrolase family protein [Solilutibacter silvestris]|uniref:alpha/beta hydrolase family protein n=1 Tax=Solilutibacter silvestris TaxID=1645665 RepID=UPI003D351819